MELNFTRRSFPAVFSIQAAWYGARHALFLIAFWIVSPMGIQAQDPENWQCTAQLESIKDSPKSLFALLDGRVGATEIRSVGDFGSVSFVVNGPLTPSDLQALCETTYAKVNGARCIERSGVSISHGEEPFPVRGATGDAEADDTLYEAAKNAWILAYPSRYQQMNSPGR